jgi:hypothetical protein
MSARQKPAWDYLIVTASHETQARAYHSHLRLRHELGLLPQVRQFLVVADWEGRRIGSGASTVFCLAQVVDHEAARCGGQFSTEELLRPLRILIVHAGGDSRRLPAYSACGKIFVPVPARQAGSVPATLFDLLVPDLLALPEGAAGRGQVVVLPTCAWISPASPCSVAPPSPRKPAATASTAWGRTAALRSICKSPRQPNRRQREPWTPPGRARSISG